jgi:hypothetical protein
MFYISQDKGVLQVVISVLGMLKASAEVVLEFLRSGGVDILEHVMLVHKKDELITKQIPLIIKDFLGKSLKSLFERLVDYKHSNQSMPFCFRNVKISCGGEAGCC